MNKEAVKIFVDKMNHYGATGVPFLFIIDFDINKPEIYKLNEIPEGIKISVPSFSNVLQDDKVQDKVTILKKQVGYDKYLKSFNKLKKGINLGYSYLSNLTFRTEITSDFSLDEIFSFCIAKYKLLYHNTFVVFSPETFVRIIDGTICSYPMKGTIDATKPDAENTILNDRKEMAEHSTIVDLIRNDIGRVAENVTVTRFRYIEKIKTTDNELLQVSSEIKGDLERSYINHLGDILIKLLPAGSVTGAPKKETISLLKECENYERNWYTGIFGVFDGKDLESAVIIRYIENINGQMIYKSGGGITSMSNPETEYEEMLSKIYVPVS
jgi:para-aminobenzoate synthetase component I